jgi:serine protease Do
MSHILGAGVVGWRGAIAALLLCAPVAAHASASIPQQGNEKVRTRCASCLARRDSVRDRQERLLLRIDSLKHEFEHERLSAPQRERLTEELRRTILALQESMDELHRANALALAQQGTDEAAAALRALPDIAVAIEAPYRTRGYLGVVFDGTPSRDFWRDNERIIQFYTYPRIALVEPSSPAEKAGIQQGDTLLAFNGTDVREREISLTRLLIPEHKLIVRVRRDGSPRDVKVIVGEAPAHVAGRATVSRSQVGAWPDAPRTPGSASTPVVVGSRSPSVWVFQEGIAGARVETITEGLGRAVGVESGVLVIRAAPGTPAFDSGLRDGDVIVSAAGMTVRTVRDLRGVLQRAGEDAGVKLVLVRERRPREMVLKR